MSKGVFVPGLLVLVAGLFLAATLVIYFQKDETQGAKALDVASGVRGQLSDIDKSIVKLVQDIGSIDEATKRLSEDQKAYAGTMTPMIADLEKRLSVLEKRPHDHLKISLTEPIQVSIVERYKIPDPPQLTGAKNKPTSKTPLFDRAKKQVNQ